MIHDLLPDGNALLALEPEELAGVVLQYLSSIDPSNPSELNRYNFSQAHTVRQYPVDQQEAITLALIEAWVWLEREGLLAPRPGDSSGNWMFVTRRGRKVATPERLQAYRRANLLPKQLLHPSVAQSVWATFLRGDYDTAVFQAFREVEIRVREASRFEAGDIGVDLMRRAFKPNEGPLADTSTEKAEQDSLMHLFAGAIGSYKNPHSHRHVPIEPTEAVEMLILASHLLGIVERRGMPPNQQLQPTSGAGSQS
jgi:uncharacterized protein (TIGR02391 family)